MKQAGNGKHVPVTRAAKAMPAIAVVAGAGTNAHVFGDVATQSIRYAQTVLLSERYGLPLPERFSEEHGHAPES